MNIVDGRFFETVSSRRTVDSYLRTAEWSGNNDVVVWINRCRVFRSRQSPLGNILGAPGRLNLPETRNLQRMNSSLMFRSSCQVHFTHCSIQIDLGT